MGLSMPLTLTSLQQRLAALLAFGEEVVTIDVLSTLF